MPKSACPSLHHQRRVAQSCRRLFLHHYSTNTPTNVTGDMEAHPLACPSSGCNGHVTKQYVISKELWLTATAQCLVYDDFSPTMASSWNPCSKQTGTWWAATRPHLSACVTDQPYSSTNFVSLRFESPHGKKSVCVSKFCFVSFSSSSFF